MIRFEHRPPTVEEFRSVAESVGWIDHFDWPTIGRALQASLAGVVALDGDRVVGVARTVGDGVRYFSIHDVMVRPDASDQGVASMLVTQLLERIRALAPAEAVIGLFASPEATGVYETLGFTAATDDPLGMTLTIRPDANREP